ncbi:unannotated protein [freshwater metagenome]|uniref:Unannotated protein n=1 Tax=freshwater metagenome TaxID=449393 RepID=A0A6J7JDZ4_9ZZZZ
MTFPDDTSRPTPTGRMRSGHFVAGERCQLTDPRARVHTITLVPGAAFHTSKGAIAHDDLIGHDEGIVVMSTNGTGYLAFRPLLTDYVLGMKRGATIIYPKDASIILGLADVFPGARVLEAGAGSGALSCWLLRAIGDEGRLTSYERRDDFAEVARKNVEGFFAGPHPAWDLRVGDLETSDLGGQVDRVVLDMLAPWECVDSVAFALVPGGVLVVYVATTTQLSRTVEALRDSGLFSEPRAQETLLRTWHLEGLAVRPDHRMNGHTGFLAACRRLADGTVLPPRKIRPAKGARPTLSDELAETVIDGVSE